MPNGDDVVFVVAAAVAEAPQADSESTVEAKAEAGKAPKSTGTEKAEAGMRTRTKEEEGKGPPPSSSSPSTLAYVTGIPTLRSSSHRVRWLDKRKGRNRVTRGADGNTAIASSDGGGVDNGGDAHGSTEEKEGGAVLRSRLPPSLRCEFMVPYDTVRYNLHDAVVDVLVRSDSALLGGWPTDDGDGSSHGDDHDGDHDGDDESGNNRKCEEKDAREYGEGSGGRTTVVEDRTAAAAAGGNIGDPNDPIHRLIRTTILNAAAAAAAACEETKINGGKLKGKGRITTRCRTTRMLADFCVPPQSLSRKGYGGKCEDAQAYLSDRMSNDAAFLDAFDRLVVEVVLPDLKTRLAAANRMTTVAEQRQQQHQRRKGDDTDHSDVDNDDHDHDYDHHGHILHDDTTGTTTEPPTMTFYYQRPPTLRLQPGPSDSTVKPHRDALYGHQDGELNYWIPLVDCSESGCYLHAESEPDKGDYRPLVVPYGMMVTFHGSYCRHYVPSNGTNRTRASLDFRVGIGTYFDPTWMMIGTKDDHFRRRVDL